MSSGRMLSAPPNVVRSIARQPLGSGSPPAPLKVNLKRSPTKRRTPSPGAGVMISFCMIGQPSKFLTTFAQLVKRITHFAHDCKRGRIRNREKADLQPSVGAQRLQRYQIGRAHV